MKNTVTGFTIKELFITLLVLVGLGYFAYPAFMNYKARVYFSDIVQATTPYKARVLACFQAHKKLLLCNSGTQSIPAVLSTPKGVISNIYVKQGIITVVPVGNKNVLSTDIYVLTPIVSGTSLRWTSSGAAVNKGFV